MQEEVVVVMRKAVAKDIWKEAMEEAREAGCLRFRRR